MPEESEFYERREILDEALKEAVKDLLIKRPFARGERIDGVSTTILDTVGVILVLYVGMALWVLEKPTSLPMKIFILLPCIILIISVVSLILSIRSREVLAPSEISIETYFEFLQKLSRVNDNKKRLQNVGLMFLIFGIVLMVTFLILARVFLLL